MTVTSIVNNRVVSMTDTHMRGRVWQELNTSVDVNK